MRRVAFATAAFYLHLGVAFSQTTLLVSFDEGLDATFARGDGKARVAPRATSQHVRLVEGRFGQGVFVSAGAPGLALSYAAAQHLDLKRGTVEFWYRPTWRWADAPKHVTLLSTYGGGGTGFRILKNQYNWLGLWYALRYKTTARVITQYGRNSDVMAPDRWVHVAASWDSAEARLFIDGRLVSVSDEWDVAGAQSGRVAVGCVAYGGGRGAGGVLDDLRLSAHKRYVASFIPPSRPLAAEPSEAPRVPEAPADGRGMVVGFAGSEWGSNRLVEVACDDAGRSAVRLRPRADVGDVVYVPAAGLINRFLGTLALRAKLADGARLPAVLFDASDIVFNYHRGFDRGRRTGWRLDLTSDRRLRWQSFEDKRVVGVVTSERLALDDGQWHAFRALWRASRVELWFDGERVASGQGLALPSALPRYVYLGSQSTGEHTFDGWISHVAVRTD